MKLDRLSDDTRIISVFRTNKQQDVQVVVRNILKRLSQDEIVDSIKKYIFTTSHHFHPKFEPFDLVISARKLIEELVDETRISISLEGPSVWVKVNLNCSGIIVKERVDGKQRRVPEISDISTISISEIAKKFASPVFTQAFIDLSCYLFEIFKGDYGWTQHFAIKHGNDYDRIHANLLEPEFITWANFFGLRLVERFGREKLLNAPAYEVRELPLGSICLTVSASPLEQLQSEVQETIQRVKEYLGISSPSERANPQELAEFEARYKARELEMSQRIIQAFQESNQKIQEDMIQQADGCVQGVQKYWGEQLNYLPESLKIIERLISTEFPEEETIDNAVQAFGAYLGEVIRRNFGGEWHAEEMKGRPVIMNSGKHKKRIDPFELIERSFTSKRSETQFSLQKMMSEYE